MENNNTHNSSEKSFDVGGTTEKIPSKKEFIKKHNKLVKFVIAGAIIVGVVGSAYYIGYKSGYTSGNEDAKEEAKANVPNLLDSIPNIFNSVSGTVEEVSTSSITVKTSSENKTLEISESIKVNKGSQTLGIADVKKGDDVTIYSTKNDGTLVPTRIVVKE